MVLVPIKQDLKQIYPKGNLWYIKNFTDGTETKLCDNKPYAIKYAETYGIEIKFENREDE